MEDEVRMAVERVTDGFVILDNNFRYIYANTAYGKMANKDPRSFIGRTVWEEFPESIGGPTYIALHKALEEQKFTSNVDYNPRLNIWFESSCYPSPDGLSVFVRDISEQKIKEEELKRSNELFSYAMEATSDVIWELNCESNECTVHQGREKFFGSKAVFGLDSIDDYVAEKDKARVIAGFQQAIIDPAVTRWTEEYQIKTSSGQNLDIVNRAIFIRNKEGIAVRAIGAISDISEIKRLQRELMEQQKNAQQRIMITALEAQEKERMEIGRELHDNINQILVAVMMLLTRVKEEPEGFTKILPSCIDHLQKALAENRKIAHELVPPDFRKTSLVNELTGLIDLMLETNGIQATLDASSFNEDSLSQDQKLSIYRIAQEQCTNIVKHAHASNVSFVLSTSADTFAFTIVDNGKGITNNKLKKGIGLRNMEGRVSTHNGTVKVESKPGQGFRLEIKMPVQERD